MPWPRGYSNSAMMLSFLLPFHCPRFGCTRDGRLHIGKLQTQDRCIDPQPGRSTCGIHHHRLYFRRHCGGKKVKPLFPKKMKIYTKRATKERPPCLVEGESPKTICVLKHMVRLMNSTPLLGFCMMPVTRMKSKPNYKPSRVFFLIWVRCLLQTPTRTSNCRASNQNTSKFWKNLWIKWMNSCRCFNFILPSGHPQYLQLTCAGPFAGGLNEGL